MVLAAIVVLSAGPVAAVRARALRMARRRKAGGGARLLRRAGGPRSRRLRGRPVAPSVRAASSRSPGRCSPSSSGWPRLRRPVLRQCWAWPHLHALHRPLIVGDHSGPGRDRAPRPPRATCACFGAVLVPTRGCSWRPAPPSSSRRRCSPRRCRTTVGTRFAYHLALARALSLPEPDRGDAAVPAQRVPADGRDAVPHGAVVWTPARWPSSSTSSSVSSPPLAVFVIARQTSTRAGVLAVAILAADPLFNWELGVAYNDLAAALFAVLTAAAFDEWRRGGAARVAPAHGDLCRRLRLGALPGGRGPGGGARPALAGRAVARVAPEAGPHR